MILLRINFSFLSLFFFPLHYCSEFLVSYVLFKYVPQKEKDKNGLIISWQIPTSSLENGTFFFLFLPGFFQYGFKWCVLKKTLGLHKILFYKRFKFDFCFILVQLGEGAKGKQLDIHTHKIHITWKTKKTTKETWNALSGLKKYVRVLYIAYMNMFLKN